MASAIKYIDRATGDIIEELVPGEKLLKWFYNSSLGQLSLFLLVKRKFLSRLAGWFMNSVFSKKQILPFVEQHQIDMSLFEISDTALFKHFNDFFYRKIKTDKRPIASGVVSPADGKILAFENINAVDQFFIKGSPFSLSSFLNDQALSEQYADGSMFIIRLAPADYHRYHFPASGVISASQKIKGMYYSVSPLALRKSLNIFCQNHREYSQLNTQNYGDILIVEVGATMVGSIKQSYTAGSQVEKGAEKGYFAFGGSTVVLLFKKDAIKINEDLLQNTQKGFETSILMGEAIAR